MRGYEQFSFWILVPSLVQFHESEVEMLGGLNERKLSSHD